MQGLSELFGSQRKQLLRAAGLAAVATLIVLGLTIAAQIQAQSQAQVAAATAPIFEYEVASIKPSKTNSGNGVFRMGMRYTPDGLSAENMSLMLLVQSAFGVGKDRLVGAPDWLNSERYDIDAKLDGAVAEELKKLDPDQAKIARQQMLQKLLADRFKLTIHRETKELPVYTLVIAKNGPKLQESKPDDTATPNAPTSSGGSSGGGSDGGGRTSVTIGRGAGTSIGTFGGGGTRSASAKGVPVSNLLPVLSTAVGRPVLDKTGLTGKYDYTLKWTQEDTQLQAPTSGDPSTFAQPDPSGPSIFIAIQEQLGLKLESGKGPVEIITIDHIEKPSGN